MQTSVYLPTYQGTYSGWPDIHMPPLYLQSQFLLGSNVTNTMGCHRSSVDLSTPSILQSKVRVRFYLL